MRFTLFFIVIFIGFPSMASHDHFSNPYEYKATIYAENFRETVKELKKMDIDINGVDIKKSLIDVLVSAHDLDHLNQRKFSFEIVWSKSVSIEILVDEDYKNSTEIESFLKNMAEQYPTLTMLEKIGNSVEGRPIWAIKISDDVKNRDLKEPTVLFNSMHHAREIMTPEVSVDIIEYLLSGYGKDEKVTAWVNDNEIWVVPMLNVDGNNRVWNNNSFWRKNTRNGYGVDLNRNYPYKWNGCNGSSGFQFASDYRGPRPASEPETQALMKLVETIRPVFDISYHSYSELVLYPYGCKNSDGPQIEVMKSIGQEMGQLMDYQAGTPWELLYEADGSDIDWMLAEHQVIPYVIELNSREEGFHPPYKDTRDETVKLNRLGWQLLLDKLKGPGVRGIIKDFKGPGSIQVLKDSKVIQNYRINPDGTFQIVLQPGEYQLKSPYFEDMDIEIDSQRIDLFMNEENQ